MIFYLFFLRLKPSKKSFIYYYFEFLFCGEIFANFFLKKRVVRFQLWAYYGCKPSLHLSGNSPKVKGAKTMIHELLSSFTLGFVCSYLLVRSWNSSQCQCWGHDKNMINAQMPIAMPVCSVVLLLPRIEIEKHRNHAKTKLTQRKATYQCASKLLL